MNEREQIKAQMKLSFMMDLTATPAGELVDLIEKLIEVKLEEMLAERDNRAAYNEAMKGF